MAEDLIDADEAQYQSELLQRALAASSDDDRHAALGEGIWRFGARFLAAVGYVASQVNEEFEPLHEEALDLFGEWLAGESLTSRADEPQRRAVAARQIMEQPGADGLGRLAAHAVLELPEDDPERDVAWARRLLLDNLDRGRREDPGQALWTISDLVNFDLLPPDQVDALLAEGFDLLGQVQDEHTRRVFRLAAISAYTRRAIDARDAGEEAEYSAWSRRVEEEVDQLGGAADGESVSNLLILALNLDVAGSERAAADIYRRISELDPNEGQRRVAAKREASLRFGLEEHERVLELLEPLYPRFEESYLTAVRDDQITDTGGDLSSVVECMAMANASLGRWDAAVRVIDQAKSLRSRYRRALRDGPSGRELIDLERALYASGRGMEPGAGATSRAEDPLGVQVAPHSRLLEAYREARPKLAPDLVASPSATEIAAALEPGEVALILGVSWKGMLAAVVAPGRDPVTATHLDPDWTRERWVSALLGEDQDGWLFALGAPEAPIDRPRSLRELLRLVDDAVGPSLTAMLEPLGASRIVVVPHFVLHLVPWWALATLAPYEVLVFPSAAQLIRSRSTPSMSLGSRGVVVGDPTGDLPAAEAEAAAAGRHLEAMGLEATILHGREATEERLLAAVDGAGVLHFTGHGRCDLTDPLRSALLVAPDLPAGAGDPFLGWVAAAEGWTEKDERRVASVPGVGRLTEDRPEGSTQFERRMDLGPSSTLWALYNGDALQALAELWTAGDVSVDDRLARCALAVLSACESGAGSFSLLDEYAGLPAAMQLAGVNTLLCSMWPVADAFAALYVDLFYAALASAGQVIDVVAVNRRLGRRVREMSRGEARANLLRLADGTDNARAAFVLEAYAARLEDHSPFADAWHWAAFYVTGKGSVSKEAA